MKNWYLIMTKPREDAYAEQHLLNQDYDIYRPLAKRSRRQRGRMVTIVESLFPRYIFIRLDPEHDNWSSVRYTRGVAGFVRFSAMPHPVPSHLIDYLKSNEDVSQQRLIDLDRFKQGEKVRIENNLFNGAEALFQSYDGEQRAIVLVTMLGQQTQVPVDVASLKSA